MKNRRQKYQDNLARLKALSHELNAMIENGSFYDLSFFNRYVYIRRVKSLYNRLLGPVTELNLQKILAAAAVVVLGTGFGTGCDETIKKGDSSSTMLVLAALAGGNAPEFSYVTDNPFNLISPYGGPSPTFVDIDGDGDLDAFVGNSDGNINYMRNLQVETSATAPVFGSNSANPFGLADVGDWAKPAFVDIDGDSDFDAVIGNWDGNLFFYRNTGSATDPSFAPVSGGLSGLNLPVSRNGLAPAFADIDDDGDFDAFIGDHLGVTWYLENSGSTSAPAFAYVASNPFGISDVGLDAVPAFVDIDGDGDFDALIGEYDGNVLYFKNTGRPDAPDFKDPLTNPFGLSDVGFLAAPAFVDIDGDGDLDAFIGKDGGNLAYFQNTKG